MRKIRFATLFICMLFLLSSCSPVTDRDKSAAQKFITDSSKWQTKSQVDIIRSLGTLSALVIGLPIRAFVVDEKWSYYTDPLFKFASLKKNVVICGDNAQIRLSIDKGRIVDTSVVFGNISIQDFCKFVTGMRTLVGEHQKVVLSGQESDMDHLDDFLRNCQSNDSEYSLCWYDIPFGSIHLQHLNMYYISGLGIITSYTQISEELRKT